MKAAAAMPAAYARNRRVQLQAKSTTCDAAGQPLNTWTTYATVWANIRNQRGLQSIQGDREISAVQSSINIHYRADITAGHRLVDVTLPDTPVVYDIAAVLPDLARKAYMDLVCTQGANNG